MIDHPVKRAITGLLGFCLLWPAVGCPRVEGTGRRQLMLVSTSQ